MDTTQALRLAAEAILRGDTTSAKTALDTAFEPLPGQATRRSWSKTHLVRIFVRDGFTDQYFGTPLVFPGTLRAMSALAPDLVPFHTNWRQSETHPVYWLMYPTIDHVQPLAKNGKDDESNIVTTSMLRNAAKSNWTLEELGWDAIEHKHIPGWDGLLPWFLQAYESTPLLREVSVLRAWYSAAKSAA